MSVIIPREYAPKEVGGEGKEIPSGMPCPSCRSKLAGRLVLHSRYRRAVKHLDGSRRIVINSMRLQCGKCGATHTVAYEHLLPYSRYTTEALEKLAAPYFEEVTSYEDAGWSVSEDEGEGHRSLVFRLVERLCRMREQITTFVEMRRHGLEEWLWKRDVAELELDCPNSYKAKSEEKKRALKQVAEALAKLRKIVSDGQEVIGYLHQAATCLKTPFSLLTETRGARMQIPRNWGDTLF